MKYTVKLSDDNQLTGEYLGMQFINGIAQTDNDFLADKARIKGFEVEADETIEDKTAVGGEIFKCPHCSNEYKEQKFLDAHIKKKHPNGADSNV